MPHGMSWFNFLPGYANLEAYIQQVGGGQTWINKQMIAVQHVVAAGLVLLVLWLLSIRARAQLAAAADKGLVPPAEFSARNFFEAVSEVLYTQLKQLCGKEGRRFFPVIGSLAMFILFS